jgi:hypothetical protein
MNPRLAHLLVCLYPPPWRERYGAEFEALLQTGRGGLRASANVGWAALHERIFPTAGLRTEPGQFQSWCVRASWAMFGLAPLFLLAAAYFVACLILWSGWRIFLPGTETPFVRIDGFAIFYFGVGKLVYYGAPILIGWGIGLIAARQRFWAVWPTSGLVLIALIGGTAQVHASRPDVLGGVGHVNMAFVLGPSVQGIPYGLFHALVILSLTVLPFVIWRLQKAHASLN